MSRQRTEQFNFEDARYFFMQGAGATDGTTDAQIVGGDFVDPLYAAISSGSIFSVPVEPDLATILGMLKLDDGTRLVFISGRTGGTGTWNAEIEFQRGGAGEIFSAVAATPIPLTASAGRAMPVIFENILPFDFMRSTLTGATGADNLFPRITVTPGQAVIATVWWALLMLPSLRGSSAAGFGGRGQLLGVRVA